LRGIGVYEVLALSVGTAATAILLVAEVIARNFIRSIYFADELAQIFTTLTVFGGLSYAVRKARHIRMAAILDALPGPLKKAITILISLFSAFSLLTLAYLALIYVLRIAELKRMYPALFIPVWVVYSVVPLGFFLAGVQYLATVIKNLSSRDVWASAEQKGEYEDEEAII